MAAFSDEQAAAVTGAIQERARLVGACSVCGTHRWAINSAGLIYLSVQPVNPVNPTGVVLGGLQLPCVAMICQNCGNTVLLNVFRLGVGEVFGLKENRELPT